MTGLDQLMALPLVADGAVGSRLARLYPDSLAPPEAFNLSHPERVKAVHEEYMRAGATLHRSNTRNANPAGLAARRLEAQEVTAQALDAERLADRCEAVNNSASALVREVVGHDVPVMGVMGQIFPDGAGLLASSASRRRAYSEQVVYLADTGATFIVLEHFSSVEEALLVLRIAQSASDAPVLAQLRLDSQGRTAEGLSCDEAGRRLMGEGADALGLSCGPAPARLTPLVETLLALGQPVSVMLGVLTPGSPPPYPGAAALSPEQFGAALGELARLGAAIVGGCCGAEPDHIRALALEVAGLNTGAGGDG